MPRYPVDRKAKTRERILEASDQLLKERGAEGASLAEVMQAAGLTVGAFYAHFPSKQALEEETILYGIGASMDRLLAPLDAVTDDRRWLRALIRGFLSELDDADLADANSMSLVLPDVARGSAALKSAFSERTAALLDRVAPRFPAVGALAPREAAVAAFATLVGAVSLARTIPAAQARARVRRGTEAFLVAALGIDDAAGGRRRRPGAHVRATIARRVCFPASPMLSAFDRALVRANRWTLIVILAAMAIMVFANVALRFTTDHSILWVEEASRYLMIWLTFLGSGLVLRYGAHIGIDTLQERFPGAAPVIRTVIFALLLAFFAAMVWLGIRYSILTWGQTTPVLGIPIGAVYLAMPIGFALMIVHLLLMGLPYVRHKRFLADDEFDAEAAEL